MRRPLLAAAAAQVKLSGLSPLSIVSAALTPLAFGVVVVSGYGEPSAALLLGTIGAGLWGTLQVQSAITVTQERSWGTLQMLAASPTPLAAPLVGRLLAAAAQGLAIVPLAVVVLAALFGGLGAVPWGRAAAALVVLAAGLVGMALFLMGALARYRYSAGMVNGLFGVVVLLAGLFVPLSAMPPAVAAIGHALPPAWAIDAVRPAAERPGVALAAGAALAALWVAGGIAYVSRAEGRLRRSPAAYHH